MVNQGSGWRVLIKGVDGQPIELAASSSSSSLAVLIFENFRHHTHLIFFYWSIVKVTRIKLETVRFR